MGRGTWWFACGIMVLSGAVAWPASCHAADGDRRDKVTTCDDPDRDEAQPSGHSDADKPRPPVRWDLTLFGPGSPNPNRHITSLTLVLYQPTWGGIVPDSLVKTKSTEPWLLRQAEHALAYTMRRNANADHWPTVYVGNNMPRGELRVVTTHEAFRVHIYTHNFEMDTEHDGKADFTSWSLARIVDDLYFGNKGEHLDAELFSRLSGEAYSQGEKRYYGKQEASRYQPGGDPKLQKRGSAEDSGSEPIREPPQPPRAAQPQ